MVAPADPLVLVGTWVGSGDGSYPTIEPFAYRETVRIAAVVDKPFLTYTQHTTHPDAGTPMHTEVGYLRFPAPDGALRPAELTVAQPTGVTECHRGTLAPTAGGVVLDLTSVSVGCTPMAKEVTSVRRRVVVVGDALTYDLWMAAVGQPDTLHLHAELHRQPAG